jgi:NAD-dependent SIR2 family protein deacetylase
MYREDKFISYSPERDVVFVFGAGASKSEGLPLQNEILNLIFTKFYTKLNTYNDSARVIKFIESFFKCNTQEGMLPSLEAVFGFLDYFITRNETLNSHYTVDKLIATKESLKNLLHWVIDQEKAEASLHKKFWSQTTNVTKNVSVISLNYDTLLDEGFDVIYSDIGFIDYCHHLLNYENLSKVDPFNWWINPREPVTHFKKETSPKPIKLIKPHGSLNWKYCNRCNEVLLTPWDSKINLEGFQYEKVIKAPNCANPNSEIGDLVCPICSNSFETLILPPSHIKDLSNPIVTSLFQEAYREVRATSRLVFIGYSFPEADVHFKALFARAAKDKELIVINPNATKYLRAEYLAISANTVFIERTFEEFINDKELFNSIFP